MVIRICIKKGNPNLLRKYLINKKIECREFWQPIDIQKPYKNSLKTSMTVTKELWNRIIILPSSTGISIKQLEKVKKSVINYFKKK